MTEEKVVRNGVEIDVKLAEEIEREIQLVERDNVKTKELSDNEMIAKELKILEERINAY